MRRVSRKDWRWGREDSRREAHFSYCVWPGDEAFVMANLEAKIEHYCEIRKAMADNTFQKQEKRGRTRGKKQKEEESSRRLGKKYSEWRTSITVLRDEAHQKRMVSKEHDNSMVTVLFSWDYHIQKAAQNKGHQKMSLDGGTRFKDMIFQADKPQLH